jgi:hypothetical protein
MNALSAQPPSVEPTTKGWHIARWALGLVVMVCAVAALASYFTLTQPRAIASEAQAAAPTAATHGATLLHDHSVVLRQNLPDEPEVPGVSIAAYASP